MIYQYIDVLIIIIKYEGDYDNDGDYYDDYDDDHPSTALASAHIDNQFMIIIHKRANIIIKGTTMHWHLIIAMMVVIL